MRAPDFDESELSDFMADLDRELKAAPAVKKKQAAGFPITVDPTLIQRWFPNGLAFKVRNQTCLSCKAEFQSIEGFFLRDIHENGAYRYTAHDQSTPVPLPYQHFGIEAVIDTENLPSCPFCFKVHHETAI